MSLDPTTADDTTNSTRHRQHDIEAFLNVTLDFAAQRITDTDQCAPFSVAAGVNGITAFAELEPTVAPSTRHHRHPGRTSQRRTLAQHQDTLRKHRDELSECAIVTQSQCANGSPTLTMLYENDQCHAFRVVQPYSLDAERGTYSFDEPLVAHSVARIWGN